ncbi:hypothetical protein P8452_65211 [Trifolium repens]|nr:hypothetical protein P8452_65211 [Trifolium repens]
MLDVFISYPQNIFSLSCAKSNIGTMMFSFLFLALLATNSMALAAQQTYIVHMDKTKIEASIHSQDSTKPWSESIIDFISQASKEEEQEEAEILSPQLLYAYETNMFGFAATLSEKQLKHLNQVDGFLSAIPDELLTLHTTYTPHFLGLTRGKGLWSAPNLASDVIIGVLDSGIWPEHVSFKDSGFSPIPPKWKGICENGTKFSSSNCNKKLIGARYYFRGYEKVIGKINETTEYRSARDSQGHGTHTASTAAGNVVQKASIFGLAKGSASGMRYTSRIAAYKVCWLSGCANSDVLAAMDQAVSDGVDVLSLSLGSIPKPFFNDSIAIASFGATKNGVFVSCSAGNSGPFASTVGNGSPWIMTVAASYIDRTFPTKVKLGNSKTFEGTSLYQGKNQTNQQFQLVYGKTAGKKREAVFCTKNSLDKKLVFGKIVVCERGINSRTEKGEEVKKSGGYGMILLNSENQGEELLSDAHVLPATSLGASAGKIIRTYINTVKKPTASFSFLGTRYGHVNPESASDPGLVYDINTNDYLNYFCSLNFTSSEITILTKTNFKCSKKPLFQVGDLNYPSFSVLLSRKVHNVTYKRVVTNVGKSKSAYYDVKVEQPNGVLVNVEPRKLKFEKLGQKLSYKVTFLAVGKTRVIGTSSFGSLIWVSGKYKVRSPIAVTWQ